MKNPKFKSGHHFKVIENGITGQIISTEDVGSRHWYTVIWDTLSRSGKYPADEVDDLWELTKITVIIRAPMAIDFLPISIQIHRGPCLDHDWVRYNGFNESYDYCKKCDEKRNI